MLHTCVRVCVFVFREGESKRHTSEAAALHLGNDIKVLKAIESKERLDDLKPGREGRESVCVD